MVQVTRDFRCRFRASVESLPSAFRSGDVRTAVGSMSSCRLDSGVTLIEVLIAGLVVSLAAIGTALMLSSALGFIDAQADDRVALYLAQQKLEHLRAQGFFILTVGTGLTTRCVPITAFPVANPPNDGPNEPCYVENPPDQPPYVYSTNLSGGVFTYSLVRTFPDYTRTTVVECVDAANFENVITCPATPTAKRITVTVEAPSIKARPVVMQTVLTLH